MMGGNFGAAAAAFLLVPVIIGAVVVGLVIGACAVTLWQWIF